MQREAMEETLNVEQVARFLGLKKGTLYNMISRRVIPYHKVGRRVLFRRTEIETWFESTLVPCVPGARHTAKKPPRANVDAERIVKNVIEKLTRSE